MHIAQVEELTKDVAQDLVKIVSSICICEWRILSEIDVNQHDVESTHGKNRIVAQSAKRLHFDSLVDCSKLLEELFLL